MVALQTLVVAGDCVSLLAVSKKTPPHADDVKPASSSSTATASPSIRISFVPAVPSYRELLGALEVTGWRSITVYCERYHDEADDAVAQEVENIEVSRGIALVL